ncbi:MAG: phosphatidate cytidylyltransferase [Defluviitaleaceae bacterium]|nr:phosphatidate cytidylyltransferase [Defluviitaleaceae bacterium]
MLKRTMTIVVGLPILILLVYLGGIALVLLCTIAALMGLKELYTALSGQHKPIHFVGYVFTVGYFAIIYWLGLDYAMFIALALFIIVMQACLVIFFKKLTLQDCIRTVYGVLYIPFLLSFIVLVREQNLGQFYVWLIFTSAFGCDTFAYLTGTAIGKHKLTGTPSPGKSVEGVVGGIVGAALVGCLYGFFVARFSGQFDSMAFMGKAAAISAIGAIFCVVGDMAASAIKRQTGIKDFGNVFPGHGGVLDRIDSIVLAAPVVYMATTLLVWLVAL